MNEEDLQAIDTITASLLSHNELDSKTLEVLERAEDALAFTESVRSLLQDAGMPVTAETDVGAMESFLDAFCGEMAAACLFLATPEFSRVPEMLRNISSNFNNQNTVPVVVSKGFARLADRIENTRLAQAHYANLLHEVPQKG